MSYQITVQKVEVPVLVKQAVANYERVQRKPVTNPNPIFLARIVVNQIRHNLTNYDQLKKKARKSGGETAVTALKLQVLTLIAETYSGSPAIVQEVQNQVALCKATYGAGQTDRAAA